MPRVPHRRRIYEDIRQKIGSGEWPVGKELPSESKLIEHYGTSAEPVRTALMWLEREGLIEGHQGKARYVAERSVD